MNADGKSDGSVVPTNPANNGDGESPAESAEGRLPAKRNTDRSHSSRTRSRSKRRSRGLHGVREAACMSLIGSSTLIFKASLTRPIVTEVKRVIIMANARIATARAVRVRDGEPSL